MSSSYLLERPELLLQENVRLQEQARLFFKLEYPELFRHGVKNPKLILDLGCGNGVYMSLLGEKFPSTNLVGVDWNEKLLESAWKLNPKANFELVDLSKKLALEKVLTKYEPDIIIMRFVLQHLSDSEILNVFRSFTTSLSERTRCIFIDIDESKVAFYPPDLSCDAVLSRVGNYQRQKGGNRNIASKIWDFLTEYEFSELSQSYIDCGSSSLDWESCKKIFLPIWSSGLNEMSQHGDIENFNRMKDWFVKAENEKTYCLSVPVAIYSGKINEK